MIVRAFLFKCNAKFSMVKTMNTKIHKKLVFLILCILIVGLVERFFCMIQKYAQLPRTNINEEKTTLTLKPLYRFLTKTLNHFCHFTDRCFLLNQPYSNDQLDCVPLGVLNNEIG